MIWNLRWRRISWFWWPVYCPESWLISWLHSSMFPNMWRAPSELVSELIGGWVWLLGWGDSGFWSAVLTVSVGFRLHLQWFHSPWSAFTSSSVAYVDVMRCRHRVVQVFTGTWKKKHQQQQEMSPNGRAVSNSVSSGWIFPLRSVYRADRGMRSLGSERGGEERITGLMKPAQGADT